MRSIYVDRVISLPFHQYLEEDEILFVSDLVNKYYKMIKKDDQRIRDKTIDDFGSQFEKFSSFENALSIGG